MNWYKWAQRQETFDWYSPYEHFETMDETALDEPGPSQEDPEEDHPDLVFHGTTRANFSGIASEGLVPSKGKFVEEFYGDEDYGDVEELLFFAKREELDKAFSAIVFQIGKAMGSEWPYDSVTLDDVAREGVLLAVEPDSDMYEYDRPAHGESSGLVGKYRAYDTPSSVEPGDVWSREPQSPAKVMTGPTLVRALMEFDPRMYERLSRNKKA